MTLLDPNFNGLPKPTDWKKVIVPLQQANEKEFRGATLPELGANLKIEMSVNAQRIPSVPPGALVAGPADREVFMEIKEPGSWTWKTDPPLTNAQGDISTFWWNKTDWKKNDRAALPTTPTATAVEKGGSLATSQDAVYKYVDPVIAQSNDIEFALKASYVQDSGSITASINWISAVIDLTEITDNIFTIEGFGVSTGSSAIALASTRINFFSGTSYLGKSSSVGFNSKFTFNKLEGATRIIVNIDAASNVGQDLLNSPYNSNFKFYSGTELKEKTIKAASISGRILTPQIIDMESTVKITALSGKGAPKSQIGIDGNTYIDFAAGLVYKKENGRWGNGEALGGQKRKFEYPAGFSWIPFNIYKLSSNGMYVPEITDISELAIEKIKAMTPYYVDPKSGIDTNTGISESQALNSIVKAISLGASLIFCLEGDYTRSQGITQLIVDRNIAIIAYKGGKVNMSSWDNGNAFNWIQDGTTWYTSRSGIESIIDTNYKDEDGYLFYSKKESLDDCKSTAGSYFTTGSTVYVNPKNLQQPDLTLKLNLKVETCKITLGADVDFVYIEGITSYSSNSQSGISIINNTNIQYSGKALVKDCISVRNLSGNGLAFNNIKEVYVQNCGAVKCGRDAMNYHTSVIGFERMKAVEINCWSIDSGYNSPLESSSNGSTAHDGMSIIRFGGKFDVSRGSTVVDVNKGVRSLNFNIEASRSYLTSTASFHVQDGKMWLYNCYGHSSTFAAKADGIVEPPIIYYDNDTLLDGNLSGNVLLIAA